MRMILIAAAAGIFAATSPIGAQTPIAQPEASAGFVAPSISAEDSRKFLGELEQELEKCLAKLPAAQGKELYGRNNREMSRLLSERFVKDPAARRQLVAAIVAKSEQDFSLWLLQSTVYLLMDCQDRELLTWMLSQRCPEWMFFSNIECALIIIRAEKMPDGALVLCDAYERSQDDAVKETIYLGLERGFRFLQIKPATADDFVVEVRKWYRKNRAAYEPNLGYLISTNVREFDYEKEGVLAPKGTNAKRLEEQKKRGTNFPLEPKN